MGGSSKTETACQNGRQQALRMVPLTMKVTTDYSVVQASQDIGK
ncbi:hypothetical protein [Halobacillus halophilus]|nr:hypothetical protein [Halobacillus halophilus]